MNSSAHKKVETTLAQLQGSKLLRGESPQQLNWLLEHSEVHTVPPGEVVLDPKQDNDTLYLVLEGRVQVRLDWQGHEALAYLGAGHCVGEMSIIDGRRPSAIVVTDTACKLLLIRADSLWEFVERSTVTARNLLYILSSRVRKDNLVIFESRQQQRISERNAVQDPLTGLYNRRWLEQSLPRLLQRALQDGDTLCLLMIDIDHFKRYNDEHGHSAGDAVLCMLAEILSSQIRPTDTVVRLGGEEFLVMLPDTFITDARIIAERLCEQVRKTGSKQTGLNLPPLTISVGLACSTDAPDATQLINLADEAMYRAKQRGRDRVCI
jgi:diguanylate cyclase (GGDEF)-like protein